VSGTGLDNGIGTNAKFNYPTGVACNRNNGDLIVADRNNAVLRLISWSFRTVTLFAGGASGFADGMGTYARFSIAIYHISQNSVNTHFYLADYLNHLIRQVTVLGVVSTFAGHQGGIGTGDGIGTLAYFNTPFGLSCDDISGTLRDTVPSAPQKKWVVFHWTVWAYFSHKYHLKTSLFPKNTGNALICNINR